MKTNTDQSVKGCVAGILEPAKRDFRTRAIERGNPNALFPEDKAIPPITELCSCIIQKASESLEYSALANDPLLIQPLISEAMSGGRCNPIEILGK